MTLQVRPEEARRLEMLSYHFMERRYTMSVALPLEPCDFTTYFALFKEITALEVGENFEITRGMNRNNAILWHHAKRNSAVDIRFIGLSGRS